MSAPNPRLTFLRRLRYGLETALVYIVYYFFKILPAQTASSLGGRIMRAVGPHLGMSRKALNNIRLAFPEKSEQEQRHILLGMWENLGRVVGEYPHLKTVMENIEVEGIEHIAPLRGTDKPAIFFGGHVSNWEVQPLGFKKIDFPLHVVYRKPNNPYVDGLLRKARGTGAKGQIEKGSKGARQILSSLRRGESVGMLVDQKMNEGIPVPFFGKAAMTGTGMAQFGLKLDLPLYPAKVIREKGLRFKMTLYPPLQIEKTGDAEQDVYNIMLKVNGLLEDWIREAPEQWLWLHRRWPKAESTE